jgi:polysaccharide export outer membrane protein
MAAKSYSKFVCLIVLLGLTVSAGSTVAQAPAQDSSYRIGPNDVLNIFVWKEAELTRDVTVMPDGKITFPLIGEITAQGLTASELKKAITDKLQNYVTAPEVTVIVRESRSQVIYAIGKLARPGQFPLTPGMTVMQALSAAGGFAEWADPKNILIVRREGGKETQLRFNYKEYTEGEKL